MTVPSQKKLISLHSHTVLSVLDGASTIDEYIAWSKEHELPACGISDHGYAIGLRELVDKCKEADLTPIPGIELYLVPSRDHRFQGKAYDYFHLTAWAINEIGYRNLMKLASISFGNDEIEQHYWDRGAERNVLGPRKRVVTKFFQQKPRVTFEEVFAHHDGLVIGSGCLIGLSSKSLLQKEDGEALRNLERVNEVFRKRFFVETMPHNCSFDWDRKQKKFVKNECNDFSPDGDLQRACNLKNIGFAKKLGLPLLMTVDSHFVKPEQKGIQDCLLQQGSADGWTFANSYHLIQTDEAWAHWVERYGDDVENRRIFAEAVENNHVIAAMAKGFKIEDVYHQPEPDLPIDIRSADVDDLSKRKLLLLRKVDDHGRMKWNDPAWVARLKKELSTICENGIIDFSPYFIFLEKWTKWTRDQGVLSAPGRGSGAGSLLCYLLKITHLDPFEHDLPFERFLSMGRLKRGKYPDIDWDMSDREPLLNEIKKVYGDKVAQCSTIGTLRIKMALKDSCRVLLGWNGDDPRVNAVTKTVPMTPTGVADRDFLLGYTDDDHVVHEGHLDLNPALERFFSDHPKVKEMTIDLLGIPRSIGRHASAFFISDRPISDSVPTLTVSGETCTQYTADWAEKSGLIKFDFLRINTLQDISNCVKLIQKKFGREDLTIEEVPLANDRVANLYRLPQDKDVYEDFDQGKTETVFQMNTPLLTSFCRRVRPRSIADLSAIVALVRPGPLTAPSGTKVMLNGEEKELTMSEAYVLRKHGKIPIEYPHPEMEPILKTTYGNIVFQEQMQRIFSDLAGYSPEEADEIRELIAKKKKQKMERVLPEIRTRLKGRGWSDQQAQLLVDACVANSSYSFNNSHASSYGIVAYQCMYLKHHFPTEWWTAVLQNAKMDDIKEKGFARTLKDSLVLPHVNGPTQTFEPKDGKVHAPIYLVEGVGDGAVSALSDVRKNGLFTSFLDFYDRVDRRVIDVSVVRALIICDAFRGIDARTPKELLSFYHGLRRVEGLKIGRGKRHEELASALSEWLALGNVLDEEDLYKDDAELECLRAQLLPIHRVDVHEKFGAVLASKGFLYDSAGGATFWNGSANVPVARTADDVKKRITQSGTTKLVWAGLVRSTEEFQYKDKRTLKMVKALKAQVVNDGDSLECVLWPDLYEQKGVPPKGRIAVVLGIVREARDAGQWSMSCQDVRWL